MSPLPSIAKGALLEDYELSQLIYELVSSSVMYVVQPQSDQLVVHDLDLTPAATFIAQLLGNYDITQLVALGLDEKPNGIQPVYGSLLAGIFVGEGVDGEMFFVIHASVPGPFPGVSFHELGTLHLADRGEATVWLLSHEICHFLKRTFQLAGPNDEPSAILFADEQLALYRQHASS